MAANERWVVHFSGRVQGVGFRYTCCRIAAGHQVYGFVKNLPDGRVELVAEGTADAVKAYVQDVCEAMERYIRDSQVDRRTATCQFSSFEVRY